MSGSTKKKYCKLLHEITNHALLSVAEEHMQEEEEVCSTFYWYCKLKCTLRQHLSLNSRT